MKIHDGKVTIKSTLLSACRFCGNAPEAEIKVGDGTNAMYVFAIKHSCGGFEGGHLSLFFKNESTDEQCMKTLQKSVTYYSAEWNRRHANTQAQRRDSEKKP